MGAEPAVFRRPSTALAAGGALLALVAVLTAIVGANHRLGVDDTWLRWLRDARTTTLTDVAKGLDSFGDFFVQLVVRLGLAAVLVVRSWWRRLAAWAFVALLSTPLCDLIKALVDRPRPLDPLVTASNAAFPSGHALAAAVTAFGIVLALTVPGRSRIIGSAIATAYVAAMMLSRTELGVHWLTDVVAGASLGVGLTVVAFAVSDLVADRTATPDAAPSSSTGAA